LIIGESGAAGGRLREEEGGRRCGVARGWHHRDSWLSETQPYHPPTLQFRERVGGRGEYRILRGLSLLRAAAILPSFFFLADCRGATVDHRSTLAVLLPLANDAASWQDR